MVRADVLIIGAGAVGTALARELSRYKLKVIVCDKNDDVGGDASKSCSSCVATAATMPPGTLEQQLRSASHPMVFQICKELDIPINQCGSLTVAVTEEQYNNIPTWLSKAQQNGVYDAEIMTAQEMLEMEPHLNPDVKGGIYVARDAQINQFLFVSAMAENAAENGVEFWLECPVTGMEVRNGKIEYVHTTKEDIQAQWIINAAGLYSDEIANMAGVCDFKMYPRRGEFFVLDRDTDVKVSHIIRSVPGGSGHGTLVIPTVDGNVLVGPNAEDMDDKEEKSTTHDGLESVKKQAMELVPNLNFRDTITQFVGLRPARVPDGYDIVVSDKVKGYVGISGIRSTGLTSSPGIAIHTIRMMEKSGLILDKNPDFKRERKGIISFADKSDEEMDKLIADDSRYGRVICRCEKITEAEIVQAINRPVGARSVDAVKRRVRAGMGRCQGGFCSPIVIEILARELGIDEEEVRKRGGDSFMLKKL